MLKIIKKLIVGFWNWLKPYLTPKMIPIILAIWLLTNGVWYFLAFVPVGIPWLSNFAKGYLVFLYTPWAPEKILIVWISGYIYKWIGFRAQNAESARITGVDFSFNSMGSIGDFEIVSLIGYTYMNPISLNNNPDYQATFSDTTGNILKYRFNHLAKLDIEVTYKKTSAGVSMRYGGFMRNIDKVFEEPIGGTTYILPGLKEYRQIYNKGNLVVLSSTESKDDATGKRR